MKDCRTCEYWIIHTHNDYDEFVISCSIGQVNWKKCKGKYYKMEEIEADIDLFPDSKLPNSFSVP